MERTWLVFRLGPCILCASALDVEGIIQPPGAITKFPLAPDYALGAFLFRGHTASAISLRRKLKLRQGEDSMTGPFIVARIRDARVAFWVDEVQDVLEEKEADWRPMPGMLAGALFKRFAIRGPQLILQTSFAALLEAKIDFDSLAAWVATHAEASAVPAVAQPRVAPAVASIPALPVAPAPLARLPQFETPPAPEAQHPAMARPRHAAAVRGKTDAKREDRFHLPRPSAVAIPVAIPAPAHVSAVRVCSDADAAGAASPHRYRRLGAWLATGTVVAIAAIAAGLFSLLSASPTEPAAEQVASIKPDALPAPVSPVPLPVATDRAVAQQVDPIKPVPGAVERVHIVVRGDTLWHIAKRHVGDAWQYRELAKISNIPNPDLIRPGDPVRIEIGQPK
jgi:chemotaxis signal transduction protein